MRKAAAHIVVRSSRSPSRLGAVRVDVPSNATPSGGTIMVAAQQYRRRAW
jgi:hypothetical protein